MLSREQCQRLFQPSNGVENQPDLVAYLNNFIAERDIGEQRYYYFRKDMAKPWLPKSQSQIRKDLKPYRVYLGNMDQVSIFERWVSLFEIWSCGEERRVFEDAPEMAKDEFTEFIKDELEFGVDSGTGEFRAKTKDITAKFNEKAFAAGKQKISDKALMWELVARWNSNVVRVDNGRAGGSKDQNSHLL